MLQPRSQEDHRLPRIEHEAVRSHPGDTRLPKPDVFGDGLNEFCGVCVSIHSEGVPAQ